MKEVLWTVLATSPSTRLVTDTLKPGNKRLLLMVTWGFYECLAIQASCLGSLLMIPELFCCISAEHCTEWFLPTGWKAELSLLWVWGEQVFQSVRPLNCHLRRQLSEGYFNCLTHSDRWFQLASLGMAPKIYVSIKDKAICFGWLREFASYIQGVTIPITSSFQFTGRK